MRLAEFEVHLEKPDEFIIRDFGAFKTLELGQGTVKMFYRNDRPIRQLARLLVDAGYAEPEKEDTDDPSA